MSLGLLRYGWQSLTTQAITQAESVDVVVPPKGEVCGPSVSKVKEDIFSEWSDVLQDEHLEPMQVLLGILNWTALPPHASVFKLVPCLSIGETRYISSWTHAYDKERCH